MPPPVPTLDPKLQHIIPQIADRAKRPDFDTWVARLLAALDLTQDAAAAIAIADQEPVSKSMYRPGRRGRGGEWSTNGRYYRREGDRTVRVPGPEGQPEAGSRPAVFARIAELGTKAAKAHAVVTKFDYLGPLAAPARGLYGLLNLPNTALQSAVKAVCDERKLAPEVAARVLTVCAAVNFAIGWGAKLVGLPTGFAPVGSLAYLAFSTAKNPLATWQVAKSAVRKAHAKVQAGKARFLPVTKGLYSPLVCKSPKRHAGEVWQGPSGRWFTLRDGRSVPTKAPGGAKPSAFAGRADGATWETNGRHYKRVGGKTVRTKGPEATPREEAAAVPKTDYEFARESAVPNIGEDLKGSARHKVNAWRGLASAEEDGTAAEMMTRAKLARAEPHALMSTITPPYAMSHLAADLVLNAFPADPGTYPLAYGRYKDRDGNLLPPPKDPASLRSQYLASYLAIKKEAEAAAVSELDPRKAAVRIAGVIRQQININRGLPPDASGYSEFAAPDRYNPVANGLVPMFNRAIGSGRKATDVAARLRDFTNRVQAKYGSNPSVPMLDAIAGHVKDVIEGDSFNKTFGTAKSGAVAFNPADAYVKHAVREGGRMIDAKTIAAGADFVTKDLGMRGLQWGNSVTDSERQHHLKMAAESLADLADVTGLPDSAMSFNGVLGLAIGARGHGTALAHYEPTTKVINLTRKGGVGSLAHEWGHGLDHFIAGGTTGVKGGEYLSAKHFRLGASNDVERAMIGVKKAMEESGFDGRLRSVVRDMQKAGVVSEGKAAYWTSSVEKFARTFERHVQDKLHGMGRENTYLAGVMGHDLWPNKEEVAKISPAIDSLMAAVKDKHFGGEVMPSPVASWSHPAGSKYASVPRAGVNVPLHDTDYARDMVSRLDKYERKWIDEEVKNPSATEQHLHHEAMFASGLTQDGLTTARGYAGKKPSSKPGIFFPDAASAKMVSPPKPLRAHEQTYAEWRTAMEKAGGKTAREYHEYAVKDAKQHGLHVPAHVLEEYPWIRDLVKMPNGSWEKKKSLFSPLRKSLPPIVEVAGSDKTAMCPVCKTPATGSCRCSIGSRFCDNGHSWHRCRVHGHTVLGDGHGAGHPCTCPIDKSLIDTFTSDEIGRLALEFLERQQWEWMNQISGVAKKLSLADLRKAASEADPAPSRAQADAGNHAMGHVTWNGLPLTIERAKGTVRTGVNREGKSWRTVMHDHYGYIKRTESAADGDHVDVYIADREPDSHIVFVVNQVRPDGTFDEHKAILGYGNAKEAKAAYLANYSPNWTGFGSIASMTLDQFKTWVKDGDTSKPAESPKVETKYKRLFSPLRKSFDPSKHPKAKDGKFTAAEGYAVADAHKGKPGWEGSGSDRVRDLAGMVEMAEIGRKPDLARVADHIRNYGQERHLEHPVGNAVHHLSSQLLAKASEADRTRLRSEFERRGDPVPPALQESSAGMPTHNGKEIDRLIASGGKELFRGVLAKESGDSLRDGEPFAGKGDFGDGLYFSADQFEASQYAAGPNGDNDGDVVRAVLDPSAKIVQHDKIAAEHNAALDSGKIPAGTNIADFAKARGHDAIEVRHRGIVNVINPAKLHIHDDRKADVRKALPTPLHKTLGLSASVGSDGGFVAGMPKKRRKKKGLRSAI